jgi:LPXTG-motif cell wall-anchored protein
VESVGKLPVFFSAFFAALRCRGFLALHCTHTVANYSGFWAEQPISRNHCQVESLLMSNETILIILVVVLLLGGGGFFYGRRR